MNYSIKSSESVTEHTNEDEHGYNKKNKILTAFIHSCLYVCETVSVYYFLGSNKSNINQTITKSMHVLVAGGNIQCIIDLLY